MNTQQQTVTISSTDCILAPEMASLLAMTNEMLMKIKRSLKENAL